MIWESAYWKEDLIRFAGNLERRTRQKRWTERSAAGLEKTVMLGFYSIRKLMDAHKVSTEIVDRPLALTSFAWLGEPVTFLNWHRFGEKYNLEEPVKTSESLRFVCGQLVHSYVFGPVMNAENGLDSVFFNSDKTRHERLFMISVSNVISLFVEIGRNDPRSLLTIMNRKKNDYDVWVGPTMPDPDT